MDKIEIIDIDKKLARRIPEPPDEPVWFAMSAPYSRELKAKAELDARGVENFVPMHDTVVVKGGVKKKMRVPVIHNLIFVRLSRGDMKTLKQSLRIIQYKTNLREGRNVPIVVPDKQMADFMLVCESADSAVYSPEQMQIPAGARVRITQGKFAGVEGIFVKMTGRRGGCVVVEIPFVANAATAIIPPGSIEVLGDAADAPKK